MRCRISKHLKAFIVFLSLVAFSSCMTPAKLDRYIAEQYGDQLPKVDKKKNADITVTPMPPSVVKDISLTRTHSKVLPLILYWKFDYRHTTTLNSQIAAANFANTVNAIANKGLTQKLNGQKLELTIEQVPTSFDFVDKTYIVLFIHWDTIYMQPDGKDLVVSYKLSQNDKAAKTGKITISNPEKNRGLRFLQSWKSATGEYLTDYNADMTNMSKAFVSKLMEEL